MLSERYEVGLNLAEVYLPSAATFGEIKLQVKATEKVLELVHNTKPQGQLLIYGLNSKTAFEFVLFADDLVIGSSLVLMSALNTDGVVGQSEAWVRIETNAVGMDNSPSKTPIYMRSVSELQSGSPGSTKRYARVRLMVSVRNTAKKSTETSSPAKLKESTQCPFLAKVATAHHEDVEAFDIYKQVKSEVLRRLQDADQPAAPQVSIRVIDLPGDYLDMDAPNLDSLNFNSLSSEEGEALKYIIVGLSHRINVLRADQEELGILREEVDKSSRVRAELQDSVHQTTEAMRRDSLRIVGELRQLEDELNRTKKLTSVQAKDLAVIKGINYKVQQERSELVREILELKAEASRAADLDDQIVSMKQLQSELERKGLDLHGSKVQTAREFAQLTEQSAEERSKLTSEKEELLKALAQKTSETEALKQSLESLLIKHNAVTQQIREGEEAKNGHATLLAVKAESAEVRAKALKQLDDFAKREAQIAAEALEFQNQLIADKQNTTEHLELVKSELETAQKKANEFKRQILEQRNQIGTLEELVCVREDSVSLTEDLQQQLELYQVTKDETLAELQNLSDYTYTQAQRSNDHVELLYKFSSALEERDDEIDQLKHMVFMIKNRTPTYVPVKGDIVDEALAECLNNRAEPIAIPFYRQDFEIYIFGTKRIFVKLDCGRIAIRVGGGFMQLEDFLEIYTKQELEKMEARINRGSPSKARKLLSKIAEAHIGERSMSPLRAGKILAEVAEQSYTTCFGVKDRSPIRSPEKRNLSRANVQVSPSTMAGSPSKH